MINKWPATISDEPLWTLVHTHRWASRRGGAGWIVFWLSSTWPPVWGRQTEECSKRNLHQNANQLQRDWSSAGWRWQNLEDAFLNRMITNHTHTHHNGSRPSPWRGWACLSFDGPNFHPNRDEFHNLFGVVHALVCKTKNLNEEPPTKAIDHGTARSSRQVVFLLLPNINHAFSVWWEYGFGCFTRSLPNFWYDCIVSGNDSSFCYNYRLIAQDRSTCNNCSTSQPLSPMTF